MGKKNIRDNATDDMRVPIPKLLSRINSVAWFSLKDATYSQSTLPKVVNATTALTTIETITVNRKYHHSALQDLPFENRVIIY